MLNDQIFKDPSNRRRPPSEYIEVSFFYFQSYGLFSKKINFFFKLYDSLTEKLHESQKYLELLEQDKSFKNSETKKDNYVNNNNNNRRIVLKNENIKQNNNTPVLSLFNSTTKNISNDNDYNNDNILINDNSSTTTTYQNSPNLSLKNQPRSRYNNITTASTISINSNVPTSRSDPDYPYIRIFIDNSTAVVC